MSAAPPPPEASASFVVETVLRGLLRLLPDASKDELAPYLTAATTLDPGLDAERRRGALCAAWAKELAADRHESAIGRVGARVAAEVREVGDALEAALEEIRAELAGITRELGETPDGFHLRLNESLAAVREAGRLADEFGWDDVPWKALLDSLVNS